MLRTDRPARPGAHGSRMSGPAAAEIGSEFPLDLAGSGWPDMAAGDPARADDLAQQLMGVASTVLWTSSGRDALRAVLMEEQRLGGRSHVLIPEYVCESVVQALHYPGSRWTPVFLPVRTDLALAPPAGQLLTEHISSGVLLTISYFGFPLGRSLAKARQHALHAGMPVIDDRTHDLFSEGVAKPVDYVIASLRKWGPLPDGGIAMFVKEPRDPLAGLERSDFASLRAEAMRERGNFLRVGKPDKATFRAKLARAEEMLDTSSDVRRMTPSSKALFAQWDRKQIIKQRRDNYQFLAAELAHQGIARPFFADLAEGTCPLGVPVLIRDRDHARSVLAQAGIYCPVHWAPSPSLAAHWSPDAKAIADRIMTIPCDQRYTPEDLSPVMDVLERM